MKNWDVWFCSECDNDSITFFVFVLARTVSNSYSLKGENFTFFRRSSKSSENVIKVGVLPPFEDGFVGFTVELAA